MTDTTIEPIYEHPFSERMRLLLRLEVIFCQAITHKKSRNQYENQLCLDALFALMSLTKRYELRADLLRELERIKTLLGQYQKHDEASVAKVEQTLVELKECCTELHNMNSKNIDKLRNIEFLNSVKHRNHDTGNFLFELPSLQYWLLQPQEQRHHQIQQWLDYFLPLKKAIDFLLRVIRQSNRAEQLVAENGVYIKKTDGRSNSHQLLRIILPEKSIVYPRVSGDQYRFAIRFMVQNNIDSRAKQVSNNITFTIHECGI